jgi:hypothetical protein
MDFSRNKRDAHNENGDFQPEWCRTAYAGDYRASAGLMSEIGHFVLPRPYGDFFDPSAPPAESSLFNYSQRITVPRGVNPLVRDLMSGFAPVFLFELSGFACDYPHILAKKCDLAHIDCPIVPAAWRGVRCVARDRVSRVPHTRIA